MTSLLASAEPTSTPVWAQLVDLFVAVCFVLALKGLSGPKTARNGNLLGAFGALVAVVVLFFSTPGMKNLPLILAAILIGLIVAFPIARRVKMTSMPQLVALFNGVGGGAAALVSIIEFLTAGESESKGILAATVFTLTRVQRPLLPDVTEPYLTGLVVTERAPNCRIAALLDQSAGPIGIGSRVTLRIDGEGPDAFPYFVLEDHR